MKINSAESIETAEKVFRAYDGSWAAAREAARRGPDGVLVIPKSPPSAGQGPRAEEPAGSGAE